MAKHLTLNFNGLLDPQRVKEASQSLNSATLPTLQTLLSKADYHFTKPRDGESLSAYLFHQPSRPASALTRVLAFEKLSPEQIQDFWLSVDPVQMIPDRDTLVLIPGKDLAISAEESRALLQSFNEHFAEDGVQLVYGAADQWFLSIKQPVAIQTTPLHQVAYKSVNDNYPSGPAGNYWRQLMNETQMLFFNHEVNHNRRLRNLAEINSVWIWGEGQLDSSQLKMRPDSGVFSNSPYSQGLSQLTQAFSTPSPESFQQWVNQALQVEHALIELDSISLQGTSMENLTQEQWLNLLQQSEQDWFDPIFQALKEGQLASVLIALGANKHYFLTPECLRRFWRRKKTWRRLVD